MPKFRTRAIQAVLCLFLGHVGFIAAASPGLAAEQVAAKGRDAANNALAFIGDTVTHHALTLDGRRIEYVARAGTLTVPDEDDGGTRGQIFYVAYNEEAAEAEDRPLTFVFNGGPGAAAAYLHMGAMGPKRVDFSDDGRVPGGATPPVDNAETWLAFSDLVFIDPIGTGYSRAVAAKDESESGKGNGAKAGDPSSFWETRKDLDTLAAFIRLYLTQYERWLSPTILAGESYGGFRAAVLADRLQSNFGISVDGLVMISPALELGFLADDRFRLMPWISRVPSFAAAARHHGRANPVESLPAPERITVREAPAGLAEVERFALQTLLPAMALGSTLDDSRRELLLRRLAGEVGLPADLVMRYGGKLPIEVFAGHLLQDEGRIVSLYDASISYPAPHPADSRYHDPRLARISAAIATALNHDIRTRLGVKTDLPYEVLNREVGSKWEWRQGSGRGGPPGAADNLENAFKRVEGLRALLVHGVYDLVTPYFASAFLVSQLDLEPALRQRLTVRTYAGGHMFYSRAASRRAFQEDARRLYEDITGDDS